MLLRALAAVVAVALVVAAVVALTPRNDPYASAEESQVENTELVPAEAAREAQNSAAAAGAVIVEDYTVAPGTPVDSDQKLPVDDRHVACGAKVPSNVRAARPR